jgi:hypothetical protein
MLPVDVVWGEQMRVGRVLVAAGMAVLALATVTAASAGQPTTVTITAVSNPKTDFVSGGDVLVRVRGGNRVRVVSNGRDFTGAFVEQPDGSMLGLVDRLRPGQNTITAWERGRPASLRVTNHDGSGPVFAGRQQVPFYCQTTDFGLNPAEQPKCEAPTKVGYQYRTTDGRFVPLDDPADRPANLATVTIEGRQLPYIVRIERGTIDRAVYELAALYDTSPSPTAPEAGWNGKLVYTFGGGCNGGYRQGAGTGGVVDDLFLSRGYAVASSSLNVLDNNCGTVISAEVAMMVKEHVAETYGPITHTIGWGGSGGAIQQYGIADAYPGILDGIVPGISYPDPLTVMGPVTDCGLLNAYFDGAGASFTEQQRTAVAGYLTYSPCRSWELTFLNRSTATDSCAPIIPAEDIWDPETNPDGVKCGAAEQWVNQLGRDKRTGFVRPVLDNVGIQYGLHALKSERITPDQFAALNAGIGGYDVAGDHIPTRTTADEKALRAAYASDIVNTAGLGLATTPIIDQRMYLDLAGSLPDIHTAEMSFIMRSRLTEANGTAANQVIIESAPEPAQMDAANNYQLDAMDRWLTAIAADDSGADARQKVIANKPDDLGDGCYLSPTERILEPLTVPASGRCGERYPIAANPRIVAGEDLSQDRLKCTLKPLDLDDYYPVSFTEEQEQLLRDTFPTGVCDYSRPGVGQRSPAGAWQQY